MVALVSFLATALVITELVQRTRLKTASARAERERLDSLYRLSQRLLAMKPEAVEKMKFLELFLGSFGSTAICMFDADEAESHMVGSSDTGLPDRTRDAYLTGRDTDDPQAGISVRRLQVAGSVVGAIGFENLEDPKLTSSHLAMLTAALLERTRALREASEAAAAAQTEVYRSAILDALAHEFKTPLATILAAAGGLSEAGHLNAAQFEMADMVETEASRLGSLTSRLLRMARLDREEVKPRMETIDITAVLSQLVDQQTRRSPDRQLCFSPQRSGLEVQADPELLRLGISQLLENACKYSEPGSTVRIQVEQQTEYTTIRVSNSGSFISARDQGRIFERFYRGADASHLAPGSGLGLYVARKIAAAHGGGLDLEDQPQPHGDITFRFTIPNAKGKTDHVVKTS
jgi:two-component system sensor histidine kinase KdpD